MPRQTALSPRFTSSMRIPASRKTIAAVSTKVTKDRTPGAYFSFAYSALPSFRMRMSGSAQLNVD
jgi:hypothetical protein